METKEFNFRKKDATSILQELSLCMQICNKYIPQISLCNDSNTRKEMFSNFHFFGNVTTDQIDRSTIKTVVHKNYSHN